MLSMLSSHISTGAKVTPGPGALLGETGDQAGVHTATAQLGRPPTEDQGNRGRVEMFRPHHKLGCHRGEATAHERGKMAKLIKKFGHLHETKDLGILERSAAEIRQQQMSFGTHEFREFLFEYLPSA